MSMLFRAFYLFDIGAVIRKNSNFSANPKTRKWLRACSLSALLLEHGNLPTFLHSKNIEL